jgi:hypothetical protein
MYGCERTGCEVKALQRSLPDAALSILARGLWPREFDETIALPNGCDASMT